MKTLEVEHHYTPNSKEDWKDFLFEYAGFSITVSVNGKEDAYPNHATINVVTPGCEDGFQLDFQKTNKEPLMSIDCDGSRVATKSRNYRQWVKLDRLESSLKLIGDYLK